MSEVVGAGLVAVARAELFKLRRRPAAWVLLVAAAVLNQIFSYLVPYLSYRSGTGDSSGSVSRADLLAGTLPDQLVANTIGGFPVFAGALALVLGALVFGGEFGWGTVKMLLTQRPGRLTVLSGQLVALIAAIFAGLVVLFALGGLSSFGIAMAEGQAVHWPGIALLAKGFGFGLLVLSMWSVLGAVLGLTLRGVALPIGLGVVWVLGVENLVSAMADTVLTGLRPLRDVLPGVNAGSAVFAAMPDRMVEPPPGVASSVTEGRALLTMAAYLAGCALVAAWVTRRRDVT